MDIETLLGLAGEPGVDMKALAAKLRGQRDLGDVLSLSTIPQAAQLGEAERSSALGAAQRGGVLREAMQRRQARVAENQLDRDERMEARQYRRGRDYEQRQYERGQLGGVETFVDPQTDQFINVQQRDDGAYIDADTGEARSMTGLRPYRAAGRGMAGTRDVKGEDEYGNDVFTTIERGSGTPIAQRFTTGEVWSPEAAAARGGRRREARGAEKEQERRGLIRADELESARTVDSLMYNVRAVLTDARNAVREGAATGPITSMLPTLREATVKLENAVERMSLSDIGKYTFGSLSEAEGDWLRRANIDDRMSEGTLEADLNHRLKALDRLEAANRYVIAELQAGREPDLDQRKAILHADGFEFRAPTPEEIRGSSVQRPARVSQRDWDNLTPEQQSRVAAKLKSR